jgi:signal transduction histidine kinase
VTEARGVAQDSGRPALAVGPLIAAVTGLVVLAAGLTLKGQLLLPWFIALADLGAVLCLLATIGLAGVDTKLRRDSRSLPVAALAAAAALLWTIHFATFPGDLPGLESDFTNELTSWIYLLLNLAVPFMVAIALVQPSRAVGRPIRALLLSVGAGLLAGGAIFGLALAFTLVPVRTVTAAGSFGWTASAVGILGLVPALAAIGLFLGGRRGDPRIASGVFSALVFCVLASVALVFIQPRYTPAWYSVHVLSFLPFLALLAGQLGLYADSVRAEQEARREASTVAEQLRTGFELSVQLANQVDVDTLIQQLVDGATRATRAERGTLLSVEPAGVVIEGSVDFNGLAAPIGSHIAASTPVSLEETIASLIRQPRPVISRGYRLEGLPEEFAAPMREIRHTISLPLVLHGKVTALLILGRRRDEPFEDRDAEALSSFALLAALLLRNVRLLDDAKELGLTKSRFLNMAAHELRTPLSVIRGYLDMLQSGNLGQLPASQAAAVGIVAEKSTELSEHVERMLEAARLEAGTRRAPERLVDLAELAAEAVKRAEPRARLAGGEVILRRPPQSVPVEAAPDDLRLIIDNLINNALTYSPAPARVELTLTDGSTPELRVADNGVGLPEGELERVFEQFHRIDNPDFGYPPGTGLGLYISRRSAERNGGSLVVERSVPGEGTVFLLRLEAGQSRASSSM